MSKFGHLTKFAPTPDKITEYHMLDVTWADGTSPTLLVKAATNSNKPFVGAQLKLTASADAQARRRHIAAGRITTAMLDASTAELVPLYARHVLVGWKNVRDENDIQQTWTVEEGEAFLGALPIELWEGFVEFVKNPANFSEATATEVLAKN